MPAVHGIAENEKYAAKCSGRTTYIYLKNAE